MKKQKNKPVKGDFGYLDYKKKTQLLVSFISMMMVVIICVTGVIIYGTRKSIYAVLAALAALPAAKMLVGYLIIMPYHSIKKEVKDKVDACINDPDSTVILYDAVLSSTEKPLYAGVIFIKNGKIYGYTNHYKDKSMLSKIEKHIKFIIDANCNYSAIKMFDNEDKFISIIKTECDSHNNMTADELTKMKNMNQRIKEQISIYLF